MSPMVKLIRKRCLSSILSTLSLVVLLPFQSIYSRDISIGEAYTAVSRWLHLRPGSRFLSREVAQIRRWKNGDKGSLFLLADLQGGGFVVLGPDTGVQPVIAFSDSGSFSDNPRSLLVRILKSDLLRRLQALERERSNGQGGMLLSAAVISPRNPHEQEWARLLGQGVTPQGVEALTGDIRVEPLVKTRWSQTTRDDTPNGKPCFNFFTPNQFYCGCVATAFAQIMRYHRCPTEPVTPADYACGVEGIATTLSLKGGCYDWSMMPERTEQASEAECQAIGRLCYDVGVACLMNYTASGSGSSGYIFALRAKDRFHFANACGYTVKPEDSRAYMSADKIERAVLSNLDARMPVSLGISLDGGTGGHQIVADGYGYIDGRLYVHLNMGWLGYDDAWYALPDVDTRGYRFTLLNSITYNLFPAQTGNVLSGRVTDDRGRPVSGVLVTASGPRGSRSVRSGKRGIYAFILPGGVHYRVSAGESKREVDLAGSVSTFYLENGFFQYKPKWGFFGPAVPSGTVGNSWGNDLVVPPRETRHTPLPVPYSWLVEEGLALEGSTAEQFEHAAIEDSDLDGFPNWEEYVALSDPRDPTSRLRAGIRMREGRAELFCTPYDPLRRVYSPEGCARLGDPWSPADLSKHRFFRFRVRVE